MKKTIVIALAIIFNFQLSTFNFLCAQGFDWHRLSISADASIQPSMLQLGSGVLASHPDRSVSLGLGYRIGQHWEAVLYANMVGANAMSSGGQSLGNGQRVHWLFVENRYNVGWGAIVQYHLVPYKMRHEMGTDIMFRVGMDVGEAEADNFWGGMRIAYYLSHHVAFTYGVDVGTFYFSRTYSHIMEQRVSLGFRVFLGLQVEL